MNDKKNPALNALRHGILAAAVVVHTGLSEHANESQADFDAILTDLVEHYAPQTPIESMLVEMIAATYWRLRRVLWFEGGQIAGSVTLGTEQALNETETLESEAAELRERANVIRETGRLSKDELQAAQAHYGRKRVDPEAWASMLSMWAAAKERESTAYYTRKTQDKSAPNFGDDRWDVAMRYEAHLNRQLHKDMKMLTDLQAERLAAKRGGGRKPRRGASRARPRFLHVVGGQ